MKFTKRQALAAVEEALVPYQPRDYKINVVRDAVRKDGDTWVIVVEPSREDVKSHDFNGRIADAGADLADRRDVSIQLTTVMPLDIA